MVSISGVIFIAIFTFTLFFFFSDLLTVLSLYGGMFYVLQIMICVLLSITHFVHELAALHICGASLSVSKT